MNGASENYYQTNFKVHHIALSVSNLEKSVEFYKKLGFEEKNRFENPKIDSKFAHMQSGDFILELFNFTDHRALPGHASDLLTDLKTLGTKHLALEVNNVDEAREYFKAAGVDFATGIREAVSGDRYFFIRDPDGILVEIYGTE